MALRTSRLASLLILGSLASSLWAQSLPFGVTHLGTEEGLSSDAVTSLLVDSRGLIWIGTPNGLNRYDGYTFRTYKSDPEDSLSLPHNFVTSLSEDRAGSVWAGTYGGLCRLNPFDDAFACFGVATEPIGTGLSSVRVLRAVEDRFASGIIWIATTHGLDRLNASTSAIEHVSPGEPVYVRTVFQDTDGTVWIGTKSRGLGRLDAESYSLDFFPNACADADAPGNHVIESIYEAPSQPGILWLGTIQSICRMDITSGDVRRYDLKGGRAWLSASMEDSRGQLWFATAGGLRTPSEDQSMLETIELAGEQPDLGSIAEDLSGHIWLGSSNGGVYKLDVDRMAAMSFMPQHWDVRAFTRTNSGLLLGTTHGIAYSSNDGTAGRMTLRGLWPHQMIVDPDGDVWILDRSAGGLLLDFDQPFPEVLIAHGESELVLHTDFDPQTCDAKSRQAGSPRPHQHTLRTRTERAIGRMVHFSPWISWARTDRIPPSLAIPDKLRPQPSMRSTYQHLYLDPADTDILWASTRVGLVQVSRSARNIRWLARDPMHDGGLRTGEVYQVHRDRTGRLWVATDLGLELYHPKDSSFEHFVSESGTSRSPTNTTIYCLHEDPDRPNTLWLGTDMGLARLDLASGRSQWYSGKNGQLPSDPVHEISSDTDGMLWLAFRYREDRTGLDLTRFDPESKTATGFRIDGAVDPIFADPHTGHVLIGGLSGYFALDPTLIVPDAVPPSLLLFEPTVPGDPAADSLRRRHRDPLWSGREVRLEPGQRDIRIEYAALHYLDPARNRYAILLEGYDSRWRDVETDRVAQYTNLSPGSYVFRVRAASASGVWADPGVAMSVLVMPPWWRATWAYVLYCVLLVATLFAAERLRHASIVRRERHQAALRESRIRLEVAESKAGHAAEHASRLKQLDESKSRFFANVSHEFRTPLTLVLGPLQDAIDGMHGPVSTKLRQQHIAMRRNTRRLLRLVNQLLDLSKLEAGKLALLPRNGDIVAFVRDLMTSFEPMAEHKGINLSFSSKMDTLHLAFDPDALEKVVGNLLSNALKFTPRGLDVVVTVALPEEESDRSAVITVRDAGRGIAADDLERIFDRFQQVDTSATRTHEGTGIGLALAKELVDLHGGTISVESEAGAGSTFTVRLPTGLIPSAFSETPTGNLEGSSAEAFAAERAEHSSLATSTAASSRVGGNGARPKILIVEDNPEVRAWLRSHLETEYEILEAHDGEAGLEVAHREVPDLVLADVMMPKIDGYEMCRMLKANDELRQIPVVMLTARSGEEATVEGLRSGADDYIAKPFSMQELKARVFNLIVSRIELRERFRREVVVRPADIEITPDDEVFLDRVLEIVNEHLVDSNYSVDWLADDVGLSRRQVDRKIRATTGQTPAQLIRHLRLTRASQLLRAHAGTVSEIAYAVGFKSPAHFSKAFRERFGLSPSEHAILESEASDVQI